ncbi:MAG: sugar ABC transporter permease [Chloroflexi bacterium]|nr:sugar ABC transporter permease [Chloroflexota bacterium]
MAGRSYAQRDVSATPLQTTPEVRSSFWYRLGNADDFIGWVFVLPLVVGLLVWTAYPLVDSLRLSFTRGSLLGEVRWIGIGNYRRMFMEDELFWKSLSNTAYYTFASIVPSVALPMLLALAMNQKLKGIVFFRFILFLPTITSSVAVAVMWLWIYNAQFGVLNQLLGALGVFKLLGINKPLWLAAPETAMLSIIIMSIWRGLGYNMLLFLASLQDVPEVYHEAAKIDGAGALARFFNVTLPLISPMIFFTTVMGIIGGFQVFEYTYVMTGGAGGPVNSTLTYVLYLYREGFQNLRIGYASALAYVLFIIILALTLIQFRLQKRWVFYQ